MNYDNDEAMDWDDEFGGDDEEFIILPDGEYPYTVIAFERGEYSPKEGSKIKACPMAIFTIRVGAPSTGFIDLKHRFFLSKTTTWMLNAFLLSVGLRKKGETVKNVNWSQIPGCSGQCKIGHKVYNDNTYNEIKRFLPPDDEVYEIPAPGPLVPPTQAVFTPGAF